MNCYCPPTPPWVNEYLLLLIISWQIWYGYKSIMKKINGKRKKWKILKKIDRCTWFLVFFFFFLSLWFGWLPASVLLVRHLFYSFFHRYSVVFSFSSMNSNLAFIWFYFVISIKYWNGRVIPVCWHGFIDHLYRYVKIYILGHLVRYSSHRNFNHSFSIIDGAHLLKSFLLRYTILYICRERDRESQKQHWSKSIATSSNYNTEIHSIHMF